VYEDSEDVAVAYLTRDGRITARALINIPEKQYSRVYGDNILASMLNDQGYSSGDLSGCELPKIEYQDTYVMPYIDGDRSIEEYDKYFVVGGNDYCADSINGILDINLINCCCCDERFDPDDGETIDEQYICRSCVENETVWSLYEDRLLWINDAVCCQTINGEDYVSDAEDLIQDSSGDYYLCAHLDEMNMVEVGGTVYELDDVIFDEDGEAYLIDSLSDNDMVEVDGTAYPVCDCVCTDGEWELAA